MTHALVGCEGNGGAGRAILNCVADYVNEMTEEGAVRLQFNSEDSHEMPVVWVLAVAWNSIWAARTTGKKPELFTIRAELEARVSLLREARRFCNDVTIITTIIENMPF